MSTRIRPILLLAVLALALAGCSVGSDDRDGTLTYSGPTEMTIEMGDTVPGTDIRYVRHTDEGYVVVIGGQESVKRAGDSLRWSGSPAAGVDLALNQRILLGTEDSLVLVGTAEIVLRNPAPVERGFPDEPTISYAVPVTYNVDIGETIPGTTITYAGQREQGAMLQGVSGDPYRRLADSVTWTGQLQPGVYLDLSLRVLAYTEGEMQVGGIATIAIEPSEAS